jgi:hypothetical protein
MVDKLGAKGGVGDKDTDETAILATWPAAPILSSDKDLYLWEPGKLPSRSLQKLMENGEESGLASCNWTGKLQLLFETRFRIRNFSTSA